MVWQRFLLACIGLTAFAVSATGGFMLFRPHLGRGATTTHASGVLDTSPPFGPQAHATVPPAGSFDLLIQGAALVLRVPEAELRGDLQHGQSIDQVAQARGMSADDIETGIVLQEQATLATAVASGRITNVQADQIYRPAGADLERLLSQPGGPAAAPAN